MKKIIFVLLFAFIAINAVAVNLDIINSSFNDSTEVSRSSQQWIDVKITSGTWSSSTRFRVFINHVSPTGVKSNMQTLVDQQFQSYFLGLPLNSDGITRRVFFDMPAVYDDGKFSIDLLSISIKYGLVDTLNILGVTSAQYNDVNEKPLYFTLNGVIIDNPIQGFYIRIEGIKKEMIFIP